MVEGEIKATRKAEEEDSPNIKFCVWGRGDSLEDRALFFQGESLSVSSTVGNRDFACEK